MKINNLTATPVSSKNSQQNKSSLAFKGSFLNDMKPRNLFNLEKDGTMGTKLFITNAFVFLLGTRIVTSRDKDEKREIYIRDIPSIVIAVAGVPLFDKMVSKVLQAASGIAIRNKGADGKAGKGNLVSYAQLENLYKYDENLDKNGGIDAFSKRLSSFGCDLKKTYSTLSDSIKEKLSECKDNDAVIAKLKEKIGGDKDNAPAVELGETIKNALVSDKNAALNKAKTIKSVSTAAGYLLTIGVLGLLIPKLNIYITEQVHKNDKNKDAKNIKK